MRVLIGAGDDGQGGRVRGVFNVRRFTALDMYGTAGTRRRRWIILLEFAVGCPAVVLLAVLVLLGGSFWFGGWILGLAVNYLPLAVHALTLFPRGRLEAELASVQDVPGQLMRSGVVQFLLLVPFVVALAAVAQLLQQRRKTSTTKSG